VGYFEEVKKLEKKLDKCKIDFI